MLSRRSVVEGLCGTILAGDGELLGALPGPQLLSAGVIARRGGDRHALRAVDGAVLREGRSPRLYRRGDPFRVASISKMVSATGFMALVGASAADLDADVSEYLGALLRHPAFPEIAITARMLLSHTSGLRNGDDFPTPFNQSLLSRLDAAAREANYGGWFSPPDQAPGIVFGYSDVNYGVIGQIAERVSGKRFDQYMHDAVFTPLQLEIGYNWSGVSNAKRARAAPAARWVEGAWTAQVDAHPPRTPEPALYRAEGDRFSRASDYQVGQNGLAFAPHGGLRLSLSDMDRLARMFANGGELNGARVVAREALALMCSPAWALDAAGTNGASENGHYRSFGLGVHVPVGGAPPPGLRGDAFFGGQSSAWRGHFGDAYGWMTGLFWNLQNQSTIVYALNGMPETDRPLGARSALTAPEETLIDLALQALG